MAKIKRKNIVVDMEDCVGCEVCESVCSMAHDDKFNPINSRITRVRIEPVLNTAMACQLCPKPDCVSSCLLNALKQDPESNRINVDDDICDGCGSCVKACPFGVIVIHTEKNIALFCDLCENTEAGEPQCIAYCPKEAIHLVENEVDEDEDPVKATVKLYQGPFPEKASS